MSTANLSTFLRRLTRGMAAETLGDQSDRQLVARLLAKPEDPAFEAVVRRHGPMVYRVCWRVLQHAQDTEDAFQATFLVLAQKLHSVRKHASLASWLHGVAHRVALKAKAQAVTRRRREHHEPVSKAKPPDEVTWRELRSVLDSELVKLPDKWRQPLILCYLEGHTQDEAAGQLGWSKNTLRRRLDEARTALGLRLTRRGVVWPAALSAALLSDCVTSAALPPGLIGSTVEAAACITAGQVVSAKVVALAEGALKTMLATKFKIATAVLLIISAIAGGSFAYKTAGTDQQERKPKAVAKDQEDKPDASKEDAALGDARELQGEWRAVEVQANGKKDTSDAVQSLRLTFHGDEITLKSAGGEGRERKKKFKLYSRSSPKGIDITSLDGQEKDQTSAGIYLLKDDRLILCMPDRKDLDKRPAEFKTRDGDGLILLVLERLPLKKPGAKEGRSESPTVTDSDEFAAILREWKQAEESYLKVLDSAKNWEERRKVMAEKSPKAEPFAERCLKLAQAHPDTPSGLAALCWAASNAPTTEAGKKSLIILKSGAIARADLKELMNALDSTRTMYGNKSQELAPLVLDRVKQQLDQPKAARLLAWVCTCFADDESAEAPRPFAEAADLIVGRFADSPDINHFCEVLGVIRHPRWAAKYEKHLRTILKTTAHHHVRFEGQFALAAVIQGTGAEEEARKLYQQFVKDYDGRTERDAWSSILEQLVSEAKHELEGMLVRAVGEPAPQTEGDDLDGRPIKLSDFRGKVVLVSFWATWCGPCMKLIPHERSLLERLKDKPFAIVGVNEDTPEDLKKALEKTPVTWRSFKNKRAGKKAITEEWKILAWPTLFLIDHQGIIRKRWIGAPPNEELDCEIDKLIAAAGEK